ncbi:F-box/LRR-repeat protein 7-like [Actinia tenebrosa]|uniref:F-box/LRR-repeat protein 7-like n=1 Tax=Actinia tenebrosa TaxID=6105 RepID=A0A6P8HKN4_ACTTE|nr:F-box/LRR-repeat protein 7-like [Actinia tenebrosa]
MTIHINELPDTVLLGIFSLLASQRTYNLCRMRLICRRWRDLATDSSLWRTISFPNNKRLNIEVLKNIFSWCTNVKEVDLTHCSLVDDGCLEIIAENCPTLRVLKVRNCKVTDFGLEKISSSCRNLESFTISYHDSQSITSEAVNEFITKCPELKEIRIFEEEQDEEYENTFEISPELIRNLMSSTVKIFHCENASFLSEDIFRVSNTNVSLRLQELGLPNCLDLTNTMMYSLTNRCSSLKVLDVSHCPGLNDSGIIALTEFCPLLEHVNVMACQCITDIAIESIARHCPNLRFLCVAGCELPKPMGNITDVAIQTVADLCTKLEDLNVKWCQGVTDIGISAIATSCPHLSHLNVSGCLAISDVSILVVAAHCKNLKSLDVTECLRITSIGINSIAQNCMKLCHLDMQVCSYMCNLDFRCNATVSLPLRHIDLSYCTKITDECLKHITWLCHNLTFISLAGCHRITSTGMKFIAQNCHELQYLDISYRGLQSSIHLTDESIVLLGQNCRHLAYLDLIGCWNVTKECVRIILECCKYLSQLNISQICEPDAVCTQGQRLRNMVLQYRSSCDPVRVSKTTRNGKLAESFILYMSALNL